MSRPSAVLSLFLLAQMGATPSGVRAESLLLPVSWTYLGGQAGASFAQSVAPAGDVDGDGIGDFLVGAPGHDGGAANGGAAYLFRGGVAGPAALPLWTSFGTQAGAAFGGAVSAAGDVNGDGFGDFIVGSPRFDGPGGVDQGRFSLFLGALQPSSVATQNYSYDFAGGEFGAILAPAGDINGDGYDDVVIGAPHTTSTLVNEGAIYVYEGGPAGLSGPTWFKFGGATGALLGAAVSGAGDVDADGYADIVVGAPGRSVSFVADGAAYIYRGSAAGLLAVAATSLHGDSDSAAFGAAVSLAGDVDADGYADVLVGAPNRKVGGTPFGTATLYAGAPGGLGAVRWQGAGTTARENYGVSVATVGDLDGDGYADFAVGADRWPLPAERRGRLEILLGGALIPEVHVEYTGASVGDALGAAVATAGDLDDDGFSDLALAESGATVDFAGEGRVRFLRGSAAKPVLAAGWPKLGSEPGAWFGSALAGGLDPLGSFRTVFCMSSPGTDVGFVDAGSILRSESGWPAASLAPPPHLTGHRSAMRLGESLARAGDVDGDRFEDLVAGSPLYSNPDGFEGVAQLFRGSPGGFVAPAAWSYESNVVGTQVGVAVAAGDFNGDGYADVLVGSTNDGVGADNNGIVHAFHGSPAGLPALPSWTAPLSTGNTYFGSHLATGDWDCDGYSDAAIGAFNEANGQPGEGRVHVFFGSPAGLAATPAWILERNLETANFGYSVANGGDIDGDGVGDLLVGASGALESPNALSTGEVWVVPGNRARAKPILSPTRRFRSDVATSGFGTIVAGAGDVDKDGYADFLVSAPTHSNGEDFEGRVWLFRGSPSGGVHAPWWSAESNVAGARFGQALAGVGDVNDDGWPDFAIGAPFYGAGGAVFLYQGGGRPTYRRLAQGVNLAPLPLGGRIAIDDNFLILHTVRSPAGRLRTRRDLHVATQDQAWSGGSRAGSQAIDTGAPAPGTFGSSATLAFPYGSFTPGVAYRYRTRNRPLSPYFAPSPWSQPRSLESAEPDVRLSGSIVGASDAATGLRTGVSLRAIEPSPFKDGARIRYRLPRAGAVALDVFDARGRHVRRLVAGTQAAGDHDVAFDGRGEDGMAIAAGVYFAVLELDGERAVRKVVRVH